MFLKFFFKVQSPKSAWCRPRQDETPAVSGPCPDNSFSILLCKGYVKDFFQILDAGRRDITDVAVGAGQNLSSPSGADQWEAQDGCWNGQQRLGGPL